MRIHLSKEQLLRPLGQDLFKNDSEAKRFFSRVGPVSFWGDDDKPIDFAVLNRELDEDDRRFLEIVAEGK